MKKPLPLPLSPVEIASAKMRVAFSKAVKVLFRTSNFFKVRVDADLAAEVLKGLEYAPHPNIEGIIGDITQIVKATNKNPSNPYLEFDIGMEYSLVIYVTVSSGATIDTLNQAMKNLSFLYSADEYHIEQASPASPCKIRLWWD